MERSHDKLKQEDACHFVSTNTFNREQIFLNEACCKILWDEIFIYAELYAVEVYGFVIMPDHLHILFWPKGKKTASEFMRGIKSMSAKKILKMTNGNKTEPSLTDPVMGGVPRPRQIWQSTYFDYITTSKITIQQKLEYIKQNPVEAKIVFKPKDYKWEFSNPDLL